MAPSVSRRCFPCGTTLETKRPLTRVSKPEPGVHGKRGLEIETQKPTQNPEIPKKHRVYANIFEKFAQTFSKTLWHESGTQQKLFRKTCSDELFYFGWTFSGGFASCEERGWQKRLAEKVGKGLAKGWRRVGVGLADFLTQSPPKGAGKLVPRENCRQVSKIFLTLSDDFWRFLPCAKIVEKCRKTFWHFLTFFDVAPFRRPLLQSADLHPPISEFLRHPFRDTGLWLHGRKSSENRRVIFRCPPLRCPPLGPPESWGLKSESVKCRFSAELEKLEKNTRDSEISSCP